MRAFARHLTAFVVLIVWLLATPTFAQSSNPTNAPAVLVADKIEVLGKSKLLAKGNVEALFGQSRLRASEITYDRSNNTLIVTGPITLTEGNDTIVLADSAALDSDFKNGLMLGARMVLNEKLQLASNRLDRIGGRYSQLYKVAATSCKVCDDGRPPIWQIRAQRVIHDQDEKQLYFDNAQLRVLDFPVFWMPRLRLPDPSLKRATGFLIPSLRQNSLLGFGVKAPYFFRIGDHKDLTLTPFISQNTKTLEWRYRQAFSSGKIEFEGAFSQDDFGPGGTRAYVIGGGIFSLRNDFKLEFDIEAVSDKSYVTDYGYSDKDRLDSALSITRVKRDEYTRAAIISYQTLRATESNSNLPPIITDLTHEQRIFPAALGGEILLAFAGHNHYRYSDTDIIGRDVSRASIAADWTRNWTFVSGIQAEITTGARIDGFSISQDSTSSASDIRVTPSASVTLRWPWMRRSSGGAIDIVEPIAMFGWIGGRDANVLNDESTRVEFDEGNLLSLSRFPSADRQERGRTLSLGINWYHQNAKGFRSTLTFGQVLRETPNTNFSKTSGLQGLRSNILVSGQVRSAKGLDFLARALFDPTSGASKAEARAAYIRDKFAFGASYVWLGQDVLENRAQTISEWSLDGKWRVARHWNMTTNWRYDVATDKTAEAGLGLEYRNECVELSLSLSRRFTSSTILTPSTDIGLTVSLGGFDAKTNDSSYTRTCRN